MPVMVSEGEKREFILPPADLHQAVCFGVWPLGLQERSFQGKPLKPANKVMLAWELQATIPSGDYQGKRFCIYKSYTQSLAPKATLLKDLTVWRNKPFTDAERKGFDLEKLIGINCLLTVTHYKTKDGNDRAGVAGISPLMRSMMPMKPENGREVPEWVQKIQAKAVLVVPSNGHIEDEPDAVEADVEEVPF